MSRPPDAPSTPPADPEGAPPATSWRRGLYHVVFESDSAAGRAFDAVLITLILASVVAISVETIGGQSPDLYRVLHAAEWALTIVFTIEYVLRLVAVGRPAVYAASFYGVVDLLAILPTYVSLIFPGTQVLLVVRILRLLRVFRVLKLSRFLTEAHELSDALRASVRKITVFLLTVITLVVVIGTLMYVVEGAEHGFTSIPRSMYWAVVTLTTVGYGDISPKTAVGQALASLVMILGYGIIAVPTGIVTAQLTGGGRSAAAASDQSCPECAATGHALDARFCRRCGTALRPGTPR